MSTMKVSGTANFDFTVDLFNIVFNIRATLQSSGEAIESGKKRTEQFLQTMTDELGLKPSDFIIKDFTIRQNYGSEPKYTYEKSIMLKMRSDLKVLEKMSVLMEQMSDIECNVSFEISDEREKEQIVLQSAINDSKSKAEMIATSLGKKIVGIEDVNYEYTAGERSDYSGERNLAKSITVNDVNDLASQLKNPVKHIKKTINIIWIME